MVVDLQGLTTDKGWRKSPLASHLRVINMATAQANVTGINVEHATRVGRKGTGAYNHCHECTAGNADGRNGSTDV